MCRHTVNRFFRFAFNVVLRGTLHLLQIYINIQFSPSTFSYDKQIHKSCKSLHLNVCCEQGVLFCFVLEARSHCVVLAGLELSRYTRLILNA